MRDLKTTSFKLPYGLNNSFWDMSINISSDNNAIRLKRQITLAVLIIFLLGVVFWFLILAQTLFNFSQGGILQTILWSVGYFWLLFLLCTPTATKQIGANFFVSTITYAIKSDRKVGTRAFEGLGPLQALVGIKGLTKEGTIVFDTNEVGHIYELIGNASVLMFDEDRGSVLNGTRNFYRRINPSISLTYDTITSPQKTNVQIKNMKDEAQGLAFDSPNLKLLNQKESNVLRDWVGKEFKSIHQYVIVRAKNTDNLRDFDDWLQAQLSSSSNYLKDYRLLGLVETRNYLNEFFAYPEMKNAEKTASDSNI